MARVYTGVTDRWHDDYELGRPGWPPQVLDVSGLQSSASVLELAAGTGKLTRMLVSRFADVVAVEPDEGMRRLFVRNCPEAELCPGSSDEIPARDRSFDGVFIAEAFHVMDGARALAEVARVLRPGGALVIMWNLPVPPADASLVTVDHLLRERAPEGLDYDAADLCSVRFTSGEWREPFAGAPFGELQEARFPNPQTVGRDGAIALAGSMGWVSELPDDERLSLLDEVRSCLTADKYERLWETRVFWTRLAA
jgi:SAM-dependent methyltransferase